ncbi:S-layer homology domain-containing protein [Sporobacter termitidis DSM 10068]|uniref:S-layer homology domain-containing protein n=1 Tax=Sporobacter termitidis DSM 10068 TaxID=1123282 RepID=A0A1M5YTN2_9FIRM|nr:S-layer homology domain-containing protein [Sporobacter termitidis]SHI15180.1 S-layer homology domain-containing protein [Sporobacter termitidis DSM 10068]
MRKLTVFLLCAVLCFSLVTAPAAAASVDKTTSAAAALNMMGALQGDGSGDLNLGGALTRAQFCKIAVVVLGLGKNVGQYAGYTIFPDVPASGWASGYVNLAVRSAGIMSGYTNGKFGPDDVITYGQAVTVLMKMLGYTTADVGYTWPDSFILKAADVGLTDGVSLSKNDTVTRGSAAILFVNLLNAEMNGGAKKFMETISGATVVSDVFLASKNAKTDSGETGAVNVAGSKSGTYLPEGTVPSGLVGAYGALVLNAAGKALVFVPAGTGKTVVSTVSSATASSITCADGTKISVSSSASFYLNGTAKTYGDSWVDIGGGMLVSAYYSDGGTVQSVLVADTDSTAGSVTVVTTDGYALPSAAAVYINGAKSTAADIEKYDVVSDSGSGIYNVTRRRVTGRYDDATPNTSSPGTVKVLGTEFEVLDSASASLSGFKIGDTITLLLTSDNKVAGAVSGSALSNTNYGVVTALTTSSATVALSNGVTVSGAVQSVGTDVVKGSLVTVGSYDAGTIYLSAVGSASSASALSVAAGTLGSLSLSKAVTVYECVGASAVSKIELADILVDTVSGSKIKFYATDPAGDVSILLLNDVTGDVYTYGFIKNGTVTQSSGGLSATNPTTSIINGDGTTTAVTGTTGLTNDTPAGIAATGSGTLAGYAALTAVSGVSRTSFHEDADGTLYVTTASGYIPVADNVQAYIESSETWAALSKARSVSDNLTIYYDKTPAAGGKVRVVIAH